MKKSLIIILAAAVVIGGWLISTYNTFARSHANIGGAWAQVETQYQRRVDLIPNLVNTVKGAAEFEASTFTEITAARSQWQSAGTRSEQIAAAGEVESALGRLLVTVENYPQLNATQAFRDLTVQLEGTENRIAVARKDFNATVLSFNKLIITFPRNVLAGLFGFSQEMYFEAEEGAEQAPTVEF